MFDPITHWESTEFSQWMSYAHILDHFTVESHGVTILPPLEKGPPPLNWKNLNFWLYPKFVELLNDDLGGHTLEWPNWSWINRHQNGAFCILRYVKRFTSMFKAGLATLMSDSLYHHSRKSWSWIIMHHFETIELVSFGRFLKLNLINRSHIRWTYYSS